VGEDGAVYGGGVGGEGGGGGVAGEAEAIQVPDGGELGKNVKKELGGETCEGRWLHIAGGPKMCGRDGNIKYIFERKMQYVFSNRRKDLGLGN